MSNSPRLYFIPGLGADHRIFAHQQEAFPEGVFLDWLEPKGEKTLSDYAVRMLEKIDQREPFILVGMSMGGMMAVEMARRSHPQHVILLASAKNRWELPWHVRVLRYLPVHRVVNPRLLPLIGGLLRRKRVSKQSFGVLDEMFKEMSPRFVRWGMDRIIRWKHTAPHPGCPWTHVHGSKDHVLPIKNITATQVIDGGNHYLNLEHHDKVNQIIAQEAAGASSNPLGA